VKADETNFKNRNKNQKDYKSYTIKSDSTLKLTRSDNFPSLNHEEAKDQSFKKKPTDLTQSLLITNTIEPLQASNNDQKPTQSVDDISRG
jgi:hypothetical protein